MSASRKDRLLTQFGFSLVETLAVALISVFVLTTTYVLFNVVLKEIYAIERDVARAEQKANLRSLVEGTCVRSNSLRSPLNNLSCLASGTCTTGMTGSLRILDAQGDLYNDPGVTRFDGGFRRCVTTPEACSYVLQSSYRIVCGAVDCKEPDISIQMRLHKVEETGVTSQASDGFDLTVLYEPVFNSCADVLAKGQTASGSYLIDPDGLGGICPFPVYCQISSAGYARALIARAPVASYSELPEVAPPLTLQDHGVLASTYIQAMMARSDFQRKVSVDLDSTQQGPLTVALTMGAAQKNQHLANVGYCEYQNRTFVASTMTSLAGWTVGASQGSSFIGFSDQSVSGNLVGFSCQNCDADHSCGLGASSCCQTQLKGSLWIE